MQVFSVSLLALVLTLSSPQLSEGAAPGEQQDRAASQERSLSKRQRIALCSKKKNAPLDPSEPLPLLDPVKPQKEDENVIRPKVLRKVNPSVLGLTPGTVIMTAVVDQEGCTRQPRVLKGINSNMDAAALEAFSQFVFLPATLDGKPVNAHYVFTISFQ